MSNGAAARNGRAPGGSEPIGLGAARQSGLALVRVAIVGWSGWRLLAGGREEIDGRDLDGRGDRDCEEAAGKAAERRSCEQRQRDRQGRRPDRLLDHTGDEHTRLDEVQDDGEPERR